MRDATARRVKVIGSVAAVVLASSAIAASCGGSASESPWPVEPEKPVLGPEGEEGKSGSLSVPDDAGSDAAPNVEP